MAVLPAYMQPITHHKYCQYMCNSLYSNIFCAMISQAYIMLMCIHDVCSTERFTDTTVTPNVVIAYPIISHC